MKLHLGSILLFLPRLLSKLAGLLKKPEVQKVLHTIDSEIQAVLPYAIKAVQLVEQMTPNRTVEELLAVLQKVGILETVDPTLAGDSETYKGLLLRAASAALRGDLLTAVEDAGEAGLKVGEILLTKHTMIPGSTLDIATSSAYGVLRRAFGTTLVS